MKVGQVSCVSFKSSYQDNNKMSFREKAVDEFWDKPVIYSAPIVIIGFLGYLATRKTPKFEDVLNKKGLELKDGIMLVKENGKKFTGEVVRKIKNTFSTHIEKTRYNKGLIEEKTTATKSGKEISGYFYKDGELYESVLVHYGKKRKFWTVKGHWKNNLWSGGHGTGEKNTPMFENIRKSMKSKFKGWGE